MIINAYSGANLFAYCVEELLFILITVFRKAPRVDTEFFVNFKEIP